MAAKPCLLVVDDEPDLVQSVQDLLRFDYRVLGATRASDALKMMQGESSAPSVDAAPKERLLAVLPPAILCAIVITLGLYMPPMLQGLLSEAAHVMGGAF